MTKKQKEKLLLALIRFLHKKFVQGVSDLKPEHIIGVDTYFRAKDLKTRQTVVKLHFDNDALQLQAKLDASDFYERDINNLHQDLSVDSVIDYCHVPCALTHTVDVKFWLDKSRRNFTLTDYILWLANDYMKIEAKTLRDVELQLALQGLLVNDVSA